MFDCLEPNLEFVCSNHLSALIKCKGSEYLKKSRYTYVLYMGHYLVRLIYCD